MTCQARWVDVERGFGVAGTAVSQPPLPAELPRCMKIALMVGSIFIWTVFVYISMLAEGEVMIVNRYSKQRGNHQSFDARGNIRGLMVQYPMAWHGSGYSQGINSDCAMADAFTITLQW